LRPLAFDGNFGLEREALRVTEDGHMAHTPHPFPADHPRIVRDFCENQTEINTRVWPTAEEAVAELKALNGDILRVLGNGERVTENGERGTGDGEVLWPFSNPPPLRGEEDVVPAKFVGAQSGKSSYRDYLAAKYGRYLMTYCGIHVNFSFGNRLLEAGRVALPRDRDALYLHVAAGSVLWGWIVVALTAASPVADSSLFLLVGGGDDVFTGFASVRCGDLGYWNHFTPVNDFSSVDAYANAIREYVKRGQIAAPSELYYPVRLKPRGANRLETLVAEGIDHIELRCVDLNPLVGGLVDVRDIKFIQLFFLWCAGRPPARLTERDQAQATRNFKNAARYDLDLARISLPDGTSASVREIGLRLLSSMSRFFADFPQEVEDVIAFEREKLEHPERRYAEQVRERFGGTFAQKGLAFAKKLTEDANV
jgi:glutamate--cysteine ligase